MDRELNKKWNRDNAQVNIERYCAYQERCHSEVRNKLLSHGIYGDLLEELIGHLIENNYLNEERFALQYAGGKFRIKKWGKEKIKQALKAKGVSAYSIREALTSISDDDVFDAIRYWIEKKGGGKQNLDWQEKREISIYIQSKGFNWQDIEAVWKETENKD